MSAPKTNIETQKRRHWVPLVGMALVALFGVLLITYWVGEEAVNSDPPPPPGSTISPAAPGATPEQVTPPSAD